MPTILEQIARFVSNEPRLDGIVNGTDATDVQLSDGTKLPSLKKLFKSVITTPPAGWMAAIVGSGLSFNNKGDPGANVMAIGLFAVAPALNIPVGTDTVRTSGYAAAGNGIADYSYDVAVNAAYVAANPRTSFISNNGRGFRFSGSRVNPRQLGAKFDGASDDYAALQATINLASSLGVPIDLPSGTAMTSQPLATFGKMIAMTGTPGQTTIKASAAMRCIIDDVAPGDAYYNPMWIGGVILDGAGLTTEANWSARYRHHVVLDTVWSINPGRAASNFRARDCWLGRYYNLRTLEGSIGFHAVGANHSSTWDSCDFNAVRDCHVLIGNESEAGDGNHGLTFIGCSIEFSVENSDANGIRLLDGTSVKWEGGYIGENVTSYVIDNQGGFFVVDGAICFACYEGSNSLIRPYAGRTIVKNCRIADQNRTGGSGLVTLCVNVPDNETGVAHGKVRFDDVDIYTPLGTGTRTMNGDFLAFGMPGNNLVPSVGRKYADAGFGGQTYNVAVENGDKTLTATNATSSIMVLYADYLRNDYRIGLPVFVAITYKSTQDVVLTSPAGLGGAPSPNIDVLPNTGGKWKTFINVLSNMEAGSTGLQLYMPNPQNGAVMGIRSVTLSDARISQGSQSNGPSHLGHM